MGFKEDCEKMRVDISLVFVEFVEKFVIFFVEVDLLCMRGFIKNLKEKFERLKKLKILQKQYKLLDIIMGRMEKFLGVGFEQEQ